MLCEHFLHFFVVEWKRYTTMHIAIFSFTDWYYVWSCNWMDSRTGRTRIYVTGFDRLCGLFLFFFLRKGEVIHYQVYYNFEFYRLTLRSVQPLFRLPNGADSYRLITLVPYVKTNIFPKFGYERRFRLRPNFSTIKHVEFWILSIDIAFVWAREWSGGFLSRTIRKGRTRIGRY